LVFDKASAPDLQQAQPTRKQAMCKHMVDGRGYKDGDASAVKNQILKFLGYIFYEAPPSKIVHREMSDFIDWFNTSASLPILVRASIAHLYFESIHPFEDGNGRIGRILVEKVLSQGIERPVLIAVSKVLEKRRKEYYAALERCNHTLEVNHWLEFFADVILQAQAETMQLLNFLIEKAKMLLSLAGKINTRQEKVLLRMFAEGPSGFRGGLSAEKYIAIAKTSRATATRDLQELVHLGALIKTGELRHTRYQLNIALTFG
ncbi:MAG TPA: Fic family protein, partial [Rhabdochlamydiaceae bacterium]|nr:Fic family protein [Rhabdochlamydiaceae bacterium]